MAAPTIRVEIVGKTSPHRIGVDVSHEPHEVTVIEDENSVMPAFEEVAGVIAPLIQRS